MAVDIQNEFSIMVRSFLKEIFEGPEGIFLDPNASLLKTLGIITAEQASIPVGDKCGSMAAQVSHVIFISNLSNALPFRMTTVRGIGSISGKLWKK